MSDDGLSNKSQAVRLGASLLEARGHICAFFRDHDEEYRVLLPFIEQGFVRGERAFHIIDPNRREDHVRRLDEAGIDVAAAEARGQLDLRDWTRAHLQNGRFDHDHMIALAAEAIQYARLNGYKQTRFVTHMEWALTDGASMEALAEYEARANDDVPRDGDPVICVYDLARWGGQVLIDVMRTHPMVIIGGILYENPYFLPPDVLLRELRRPRGRADANG